VVAWGGIEPPTRDYRASARAPLDLEVVDALRRTLAGLGAAVGKALAPIRQCAGLLTTMLGICDLAVRPG